MSGRSAPRARFAPGGGMTGLPRFYLPPEQWPPCGPEGGAEVRLEGQEAAHCRVLRLAPGDGALLLDGRGRIGQCRVLSVDRRDARLELLAWSLWPQPAARAVMALALSKAVRRGFFMEKAVELGAAGIWLWQGDHSQGRLPRDAAQSCLGQMIAGAKQCGNPWLPEVRACPDIDGIITLAAGADQRILPWEMQEGVPMLEPAMAGRPGLTVYVIGPEGGFSERELAALRAAAFTPVSLGGRILRCETAATLCLGLHWWASQLPGGPDFRAFAGNGARKDGPLP
ncbi:16S rRNA (uracil(1498)-N(3))-methyltransferase [uncultured Desulfovibrio sp.]|uniref:16S rRNA (uracil(1498)-N(3))-methyltransferase n=1 Tax=uncultured Desulfovibrio sp. TaxID=167968 RepID=UPI00280553A9|nr:16S rRNA (uracil(1498)-N(3))-methyltransferase [uncultured Desulfovibrio sp.]